MNTSSNGVRKINHLASLLLHIFGRVNTLFDQVKLGNYVPVIHNKSKNQKFTDADWIVQKMMENYFMTYFPNIHVVGEEDTSVEIVKESEYLINSTDINFDLVPENLFPDEIKVLDPNELTAYIDPIDSTDQFILKNYEPVTSLVGFCYKSTPLIGFIHLPSLNNSNPTTFFNIPGCGIYEYDYIALEIKQVTVTKLPSDQWTFVSSATKTHQTMHEVFNLFPNLNIVYDHGLGKKSYLGIINDYVYLATGFGLGSWDICAGHCLARELGGGCFYQDASEVVYDENLKLLGTWIYLTSNSERIKSFSETYAASNIHFGMKE